MRVNGNKVITAGMNKVISAMISVLLAQTIVLAAEQNYRFVEKMKFPAGPEVVVVAEGEFEPRSIGSYSVRVYSGANPEYPLDDYIAGIVLPRDGVIARMQFQDLDGDGIAEIIVIIRSTGSGGYLSADAFSYGNKSLKLLVSVLRLAKGADPIPALTEEIRKKSRESSARPRVLRFSGRVLARLAGCANEPVSGYAAAQTH